MKPITPKEVIDKKAEQFPDGAIEAFNQLIAQNWDGHKAIVLQKDAAALVAAKLDCTITDVYKRHLLDVEDIYRKAGWVVKCDKPGYNEDYEATFEFKKKPTRGER